MSYGEDVLKLRKRVADAVLNNVIDDSNKDIIEALLLQVMNDAERSRQQCISQAENLKKQAATLEGQAGAYSAMGSIVYNVLNGFVRAAERAKEEETMLAADKATGEESSETILEESDTQDAAKSKRRK